MAKKNHLGTSPFTHVDDRSAPVHTTHPDHQEAYHYGADAPEPEKRAEIILGPPPFGSPDVRTLGNRMHPFEDRPASAPPLDPDFHEIQGTSHITHYTDEEILSMSKAELLDLARENGVEVKSSATKDEILTALGYGEDDDEDEDSDSDESESETQAFNSEQK